MIMGGWEKLQGVCGIRDSVRISLAHYVCGYVVESGANWWWLWLAYCSSTTASTTSTT